MQLIPLNYLEVSRVRNQKKAGYVLTGRLVRLNAHKEGQQHSGVILVL